MKATTVSVEFCPIDAKDNALCGYNPVAYSDSNGPVGLGPKNGTKAMLMEREYLTELYKLQQRIAAKYEVLFDCEEPPLTEDEGVYGHGLTEVAYREIEATAIAMFPGPEAEYYT